MSVGKISGPVSTFYTEYDGIIYNFYGDAHGDMSAICKDCNDFDIKTKEKINVINNCWDITRILDENFTKAYKEGKYIDFYLEIPFAGKTKILDTTIEENVKKIGYIYKIWSQFLDCYAKKKCYVPTTRFHHINVRKTTGELRGKPVDYDRVLTEMMSQTIQRFIDGLKNDNYQPESVVKLDSLIRDFYFSDKNNIFLKLMLKSQDFIFDVKTLLGNTIDNTGHNMSETIYDTIFDDDMIVFRNNKTLYRIGAQLYGLRNDGREKLADAIEEFILKEYRNTNINSYIKDLWTAFMTIHSGNLKNKNTEKIEEFLKDLKENLRKTVEFRNMSGSFIMDAYALSRMFRVFKNKP